VANSIEVIIVFAWRTPITHWPDPVSVAPTPTSGVPFDDPEIPEPVERFPKSLATHSGFSHQSFEARINILPVFVAMLPEYDESRELERIESETKESERDHRELWILIFTHVSP
jgi:hypothetical protein